MRPIPIPPSIAAVVVLAAQYGGEQLSPPPSSSASRCDPHACVRRSSGGEIEANAAMILIVMSCALICALALKISICCSLRHSGSQLGQTQQQHQKPNMHEEVQQPPSPTLVYSVGMRLAGEEAECAICLSEFVEGDGIRVLDRCKHGFHVHCVHQWLSSHSSCPTCRASCLPSLAVSDEESGATNHNSGPDRGVPDSV